MFRVGDDTTVDSEHLLSIAMKSSLLQSGEIMIATLQKTRAVSSIQLGNFHFAGSKQLRFYVMRYRVGVLLNIYIYISVCDSVFHLVDLQIS